jgi:DNA-binding XRE family transcriptional regulator
MQGVITVNPPSLRTETEGRPHLVRIPKSTAIRTLIVSQERSFTELAADIGHNRQYVSSIISGKLRVDPDTQICHRIAEALGGEVDELFPVVNLNERVA